ncbi:hypothetical protein QBC41DRAFT_306526 [Cercophora samala]|uniref:Uncharacterized protein n=1 Tax=Cercophora samala TaxID=330535 RepID=A0AA40D8U9_9PEZI|nr:hypothetical protein QBC41DRAFT_306526 [Cercophora samala]
MGNMNCFNGSGPPPRNTNRRPSLSNHANRNHQSSRNDHSHRNHSSRDQGTTGHTRDQANARARRSSVSQHQNASSRLGNNFAVANRSLESVSSDCTTQDGRATDSISVATTSTGGRCSMYGNDSDVASIATTSTGGRCSMYKNDSDAASIATTSTGGRCSIMWSSLLKKSEPKHDKNDKTRNVLKKPPPLFVGQFLPGVSAQSRIKDEAITGEGYGNKTPDNTTDQQGTSK